MTSPAIASPEAEDTAAPLGNLAIAFALAAIADWLLFRHYVGIAFPVFLLALAGGVVFANLSRLAPSRLAVASGALLLGLLPSVETLWILPVLFAVAGISVFALIVTDQGKASVMERAKNLGALLLVTPIAFLTDMIAMVRRARRSDTPQDNAGWLTAWIVPVAMSGIFIALFWSANPVVDLWFARIDLSILRSIDPLRPLFWLLIVAVTWPLLRDRLANLPAMPIREVKLDLGVFDVQVPSTFFGPMAILRSLVLFNLLFTVQTAMDLAYLWGGLTLPAGMSYAQYAHAGAYPLIVTALLAAAFVLVATRPGGPAEGSGLIRALVFAWIGQNVLLVVSSIFRLKLYVEAYALTQWRIAAFIWMGLVAVGLVLIVVRIARVKSNGWLISRNVAALVLTLYACSMIDFRAIIAEFNVAHSRELGGKGVSIDVGYLCEMGPTAIPAMDRLAPAMTSTPLAAARLARCRDWFAAVHRSRQQNWRAWTYRASRLMRYLHAREPVSGSLPPRKPCQGDCAWRTAS